MTRPDPRSLAESCGHNCPECPPADLTPTDLMVRRIAVALSSPTLPECHALGHYRRQARRVALALLQDPVLHHARHAAAEAPQEDDEHPRLTPGHLYDAPPREHTPDVRFEADEPSPAPA